MRFVRVALIVAGAGLGAYALVGALLDPDVNRVGVPLFAVAVLALHDGVFMPLVLAVATLVRKGSERRGRPRHG